MKLEHLLRYIDFDIQPDNKINSLEIKGLSESSAFTKKDFLFIAIKGHQSDGHDYITDAINNGASVIIGESHVTNLSIPYIRVKDSRKSLAIIAGNYYGNPSNKKIVIGITGTNGKTTTSYLIKHIMENNGVSCGLIGTIETIINGESMKSLNTTPGSLVINELLEKSNDKVVILEASSHGLLQHRLDELKFDICLFLNLSHEHLDYHNTIEEYFETKASLFEKLKEDGQAIINIDDRWGEKLNTRLKLDNINTFTIGQTDGSDYHIAETSLNDGSFKLKRHQVIETIYPSMVGIHNMYNACMAYTAAHQLAIEEEAIIESLKTFSGVDGRFQVFPLTNGAKVVIDYAHTTDAFFHCLQTVKAAGANRIIHIFGFRGNRDKTKRKTMFELTAELSDQYLLTLDDLNEVPIEEMIQTLKHIHNTSGNHKGLVVPDRTLAIKKAMENSIEGDWIVITGKGHEFYQQEFALPTKSDKDTVLYLSHRVE